MPTSAPAPAGDGPAESSDSIVAGGADAGTPRASVLLVWLRVAQFGVDLAIVALLSFAASLSMELIPKAPDGTYGNPVVALLALLLVLAALLAINVGYWIVWPGRHGGQTPAMSWFGLRITSTSGTCATYTQLALRTLLLAADGMFFGLVGVAAMLSNPARQRLGDAVASTIVIRTDPLWGRSSSQREHH